MSFARYPEYKDSCVEWLGAVPEHWEVWKLAHAFTLVGSGTTPKTDNREYYDDGDIPWVNTGDLNDGELDYCEKRITALALAEHTSLKIYPAGSLLIAMYGATIGKLAMMHFPATVNQACCVFAGKSEIVSKFMFYWFLGLRQQILSLATGGGQPNISQDILRSLRVACPNHAEQTQIAAFLDRETAKIDGLVAEQRRLMALLKEKRQSVISHAVTRGLNPDAPMKPSGIKWLGNVPAHWEISAIKRFADKITDGAHVSPETENGVFHFVSTKDVGADSIDFENCLRTSVQSFEYLVKTGCRPLIGDVLFSKDGTIGRTVVVREERDFVVASSLIIIRPTASILDSNFLNCLCQSQGIANQVDCFVKGAGLPRLSIQNLTKVIGCFPPLDEQKAIAGFLDAELAKFDTLTAEAQRAIDLLQERRTALISAAVTGQIDVRTENE